MLRKSWLYINMICFQQGDLILFSYLPWRPEVRWDSGLDSTLLLMSLPATVGYFWVGICILPWISAIISLVFLNSSPSSQLLHSMPFYQPPLLFMKVLLWGEWWKLEVVSGTGSGSPFSPNSVTTYTVFYQNISEF